MDMRIKEEQQYTKVASLQLSLVSLSKLVNFHGAGSKVLIYLSFLLRHISNAKRKISKSKKSELWNRLSYRGLPYFFEVAASKFNIDCSLTSMASKMALPYISKIASNQCICSKDWWELWIVGRDRKNPPKKPKCYYI